MGYMDAGVWRTSDPPKRIQGGRYVRPETQFRSRVSADGSSGFAPEAGRYHLYVAHACPWAHRTLMLRGLKGLEDSITVSFALPLMLENGWELEPDDGPVAGARYMHDVYRAAPGDYSGRCSVPVLWDRERQTIVSNESADIVRMLNSAFDHLATRNVPDLYPADLHSRIDELNELVYHDINNGVYKCGFAVSQEAYEESFLKLFAALDRIEKLLASNRYLCGTQVTEADWRLFATLVRFDAVYVSHFKCNLRRIADYANLSNYTRELYQWPGIAETFDLELTKQHYFGSHESINPHRIVPLGPVWDMDAPHDRSRLPCA
ncbi:MAG: glutathione S-transferase family protein [Pseudomonadota bacterium]